MIGVIVWTDETCEKAVIWCEDQSDLAYYVCKADAVTGPHEVLISKGDLVTFQSYYDGDCRMAQNLQLVEEDTHPLLAEYLTPDQGHVRAAKGNVAASPVAELTEEPVAEVHFGIAQNEFSDRDVKSADILPFHRGAKCTKTPKSESERKSG